jgi:hypothetical protein
MVVVPVDVTVEPARTAKLLAVPRSTSTGVALRCVKVAAATTRPILSEQVTFISFAFVFTHFVQHNSYDGAYGQIGNL